MGTKRTDETLKIVVKSISGRVTLPKPALRLLQIFIEQHPPSRWTKNLRKMLFHFLMSEGGMEEEYISDLLYDLDALLSLTEELTFTIVEE